MSSATQGGHGAVVAFVSQKGGVGKSTLSRGLAREAAKAGLRVKIADLDIQQHTCVDWQRRRLAAGLEPRVWVEQYATAEQALEDAKNFDLLIIDGPARASKGTEQIARAASVVIQPVEPCLDDLDPAIMVFHELAKAGISKQKLAFAINNVITDAEEAAARRYLSKAGYDILAGYLPVKNSYRDAHNHGRAITETKYDALNSKADALIQSVIDRIPTNG
jgi:chromosome partitioning protein